jgi:RimJ/RimL family protein N-acetyltransferase
MIYGERVRLRGIERGDLARYYEWINDPDVLQGLSVNLPMSTVDEERWFDGTTHREQAEKPLANEVQEQGGWRLIGNCAFFDFDWTSRAAEFGIMIGDKSVWDQGYGTETVRLLVKHGFETLNLNRIVLRVFDNNRRAVRAYEKAGFTLEGTLRQAAYKNGAYHDMYVMSVLRREWDKNSS